LNKSKRRLRPAGLGLASVLWCTVSVPLLHCGWTLTAGPASAQTVETSIGNLSSVQQDVEAVCELVRTHYAYFESRRAVWDEACETAREESSTTLAQTRSGHLALLERLLDQLYDNHVSLNTNSAFSPRLVPSGSDYWLDYVSGVSVVTAVRPRSGAAAAGLAVGDVMLEMNDMPVLDAALSRIRAGRNVITQDRLEWALNAQGAGYRGSERRVRVKRDDESLELDLGDPVAEIGADKPVTWKRLSGNVGYIRFEDSLGNRDVTVEAFDAALEALRGSDGWIVDLRNTPGGGNTETAEPILARFIRGVRAYQAAGPRWEGEHKRYVASRGPWRVRGRVAVLAGRWTGSMGEGMAVGFDGLRRGRVFGGEMAGLAGGIESFELPGSGMQVRFPTYNLLHVKGINRHDWRPPETVTADNGNGPDLALNAALDWVRR